MRIIPTDRFEVECLELLDEIQTTRETILITKSGRPHVRVAPIDEEEGSLRGSVLYHVSTAEPIAPIDERWDAETE
jgi:antitoxin (DNA-binding transcriptional repressor) of toxin-antitoxin stability system